MRRSASASPRRRRRKRRIERSLSGSDAMSYRHTIHSILAVSVGISVGCGAVTALADETGIGGPFGALDKARAAATASAERAVQSDARAAEAFGAATPPANAAAEPAS